MTTGIRVDNRTGPCWVEGCHGTVELFLGGGKWNGQCDSCHRSYEMPASRGEIVAFRTTEEAMQRPRRHLPSRFPCPMPDCQGDMEYRRVGIVYDAFDSDYHDDYGQYVCGTDGCGLTLYLERFNAILPGQRIRSLSD